MIETTTQKPLDIRQTCCCLFLALTALLSTKAAADIQVPFHSGDWIQLSYSGIPANAVDPDGEALTIDVDQSASPLIHSLETPVVVDQMTLKARIEGGIALRPGVAQGSKEADDFRLRVGLVYQGDKRMNMMQRMIAPKWLKTMFDLAPEDQGISRVEFFGTWTDSTLAGSDLTHFATDLWQQHFVLEVSANGEINQQVLVPSDAPVVALWLSSDGDNTGSQFSVQIEEITLHPVNEDS